MIKELKEFYRDIPVTSWFLIVASALALISIPMGFNVAVAGLGMIVAFIGAGVYFLWESDKVGRHD